MPPAKKLVLKLGKDAGGEDVVQRTYPEHAKLFPTSRFDIIHEFFDFLRGLGVTDLAWDEVHGLIRKWQGVDPAKFQAEAAQMKVDYAWLWEKYGLLDEEQPQVRLRVTRPPQADAEAKLPTENVGVLDFLIAKIENSRG